MTSIGNAPYVLKPSEPEWERLDEMSNGIRAFMGGRLTFAPIEEAKQVKNILELGAGSGAWVIHAAETFPEAEVTAADMSPLPPRPFPANVKPLQVNVLESWPFRDESYDIVHTRFVLIHLPHFRSILEKLIRLVRPGGFLILEDGGLPPYQEQTNIGPATKQMMKVWMDYSKEQNQDVNAGSKFKLIMEDSKLFSRVDAMCVTPPVEAQDPNLRLIGDTMRKSVLRAMSSMNDKVAVRIEPGLKEQLLKEMENSEGTGFGFDLYFVWGQKA